jgi:hypothetical protein
LESSLAKRKKYKTRYNHGNVKALRSDFPNIRILLEIFAIIPVTTASPERNFSTLRRLKNNMRSTMGQEHLNGLAVFNIYKEISVNEIMDIFSKTSRRMKLDD